MQTLSKAIILARVSSKAQEDEGYSLDSQIKLLRDYCNNKNFKVIKEFKITETAFKQERRTYFRSYSFMLQTVKLVISSSRKPTA